MAGGTADGVRRRLRHQARGQKLPDGERILQWARAMADLEHSFDLPVFLKFGGMDAEVLWMRMRIRRKVYRFSIAEFSDFACESVCCYGRFLDALAHLMDRRLLMVCA